MTDVGSRSQNIEMARVSTEVTEPYRAALNGDWEAMKSFYENNPEAAVLPLTVTNDTPLHIAVYSGTKSPLEELLRIVPDGFSKPNDLENTPLHEAGVIGNVEAARVLVRCSASVGLGVRNALGETPLFRAAAFGMTEMVKYLAAEVGRVQGHDMEVQRVRYDGISILHIAIIGQHFETALWLLGNDDMLGEAKDESGRTCLHLLADMPSAFKSGSAHEGRLKELIYFCLPADENDEETRVNLNQKDLESGWGEKDHNHKCSRCSIIIPTGV
ncbi:hypothetical protein TIFTF001_006014 [Ficus carica]|uniref:Uncharacterized protein n=1 Tax=Ficus carica TaxID=3494 RepID=A0AA88CY78_FICCA|nr:hypothetical protein TIFTF001_006014 [Ficus carica]